MPFIASLSEDRSEILIKGIKEEIAYSAAGDDKTVSAFLHRLAPRVVKPLLSRPLPFRQQTLSSMSPPLSST